MLICDSGSDYSKTRAVLVCSGTIVLFAGLEALLVLTLRVCLLPPLKTCQAFFGESLTLDGRFHIIMV
jgi:hypothetical protein